MQRLQHDFTCVYYWLEIELWRFMPRLICASHKSSVLMFLSVYCVSVSVWRISCRQDFDAGCHRKWLVPWIILRNACTHRYSHLLPLRKDLHRYCLYVFRVAVLERKIRGGKERFSSLLRKWKWHEGWCTLPFTVWGQ